ncbi:MAG: hypothetical protein COV67_02020 [Nitrospinae bacterium CG11_big_fil_rev_8_21_14_0_20_56_8]|nr:MAG: hypothetical protein COV67_02020 [Nitrospinae bacterium CG11_big_fil_rev_8_21_14_0_20_56_8]
MLDPIDPIGSLSALIRTGGRVAPGATGGTSSAPAADSVSLSADSIFEAVRSQVAGLKQDLPGVISQSLLSSLPTQGGSAQEPLNALLSRLNNPLETLVRNLPPEALSDNLISGLQAEIVSFRDQLPGLRDHALLAQFSSNLATRDPLSPILDSLSNQLGTLIDRLREVGLGGSGGTA